MTELVKSEKFSSVITISPKVLTISTFIFDFDDDDVSRFKATFSRD